MGREETSDEVNKALEARICQLSTEDNDKLSDAESKAIAKEQKQQLKEVKKLVEAEGPDGEKLAQLQAKFTTLLSEHKKQEREMVLANRKLERVTKEKDAAVGENSRLTGVKGKLETLCRELQKQNKSVMDDSKRVAEEEHAKRQQLSEKFQDTIKDVSAKLDTQGEDRIKQFQENDTLREKLKNFAEQYELREQHFAHQLKTKDLEHQLVEAKLKHQTELNAQETAKIEAYKAEFEQRAKTEIELRTQLAAYSEKFETFQDTLSKSNDVFGTFKKEMDKMSKTIKTLEKENLELKKKAKKCDIELIKLHDERETGAKEVEKQKKMNAQLQSLCKTLQAERKQAREETKAKEEVMENFAKADLD